MTTEIWRAVLGAPFYLEGFGSSREHAFEVLERGWLAHCDETGISPDYLRRNAEDVSYYQVRVGECYLDRQVIVEQE